MSGLFDTLNAIFYKKEKYEYNKKDTNGYGLSLWISHDNNLCSLVNEINPFIFNLKDELIFRYFYYKIPKGKRYIKWVKKDKEKENKFQELAKKYHCSIDEIKKSVIL